MIAFKATLSHDFRISIFVTENPTPRPLIRGLVFFIYQIMALKKDRFYKIGIQIFAVLIPYKNSPTEPIKVGCICVMWFNGL
jgi:predicted cation transporter